MYMKPERISVKDDFTEIEWYDKKKTIHRHKFLRMKCLCAICVGESNKPIKILEDSMDKKIEIPIQDNIKPIKFVEVGNYGLNVQWNDEHRTGVYSYEYLIELCECKECKKD